MCDLYFNCLVQDNDQQVKTAFNTLLTYIKNVATKPDEEKFRKIRLSNATFQVISLITHVTGSYYLNLLLSILC